MSNNPRFDSKDYYPPYYKEVFIEYCPADGDRYVIVKAWLAVNDSDELVWTLARLKKFPKVFPMVIRRLEREIKELKGE